jgi:penicillin-binding protein 1B
MAKKTRRSSSRRSIEGRAKPQISVIAYLCWRVLLIAIVASALWLVYLDFTVREKFDGKKWAIPARVYAQPLELYEGLTLSAAEFEREMLALGYQFVSAVTRPGQVVRRGENYEFYSKGFVFWDKVDPQARYQVGFSNNTVISLRGAKDLMLRLEPQEIGSIYPTHGEDRVLVSLEQKPALLGAGLIAVEDKNFANHLGISIKGISRAMLANIQAGGFVQGGSTLTQQLVKNFYLTHERSLWRKLQEAAMSLLLEIHYTKADILEAYINEVYLGQSGARSINGFGLAAQYYFNQPLDSLKPHQIALLIGVVKGASYYNPWRSAKRAQVRRDLVLDVMYESHLIDQIAWQHALKQPLDIVTSSQKQIGEYPAFLEIVKRQLQQDYQREDLQSEGLRIFTTLSPKIQRETERAMVRQMQVLNQRSPTIALQAAVVITAVGSGEVVAAVGDANPRFSGFNRVLDAERQIGSLVKPFVYLTALKQPKNYQLSSMLEDTPLRVDLSDGSQWQPQNYSKTSYGLLPLYQALAYSYNQATARLGLQVGVEQVIATLRQAGLQKKVEPFPSVLLGAISLTPFEVSHLYHTLAADGVYTPLRAIRSVMNANNQLLQRYGLSSEPRFNEAQSHLMHFALQAVMRIGTGRSVYRQLPTELALAGKTGTSNDQRDSWFAGYSGDHLGVVWVGNDDNKPTTLTGSSGALTIWTDVFKHVETRSISQTPPDTIDYFWIDPLNNLRSAEGCENAQIIPFIKGSEPTGKTNCDLISDPISRWFKKLF